MPCRSRSSVELMVSVLICIKRKIHIEHPVRRSQIAIARNIYLTTAKVKSGNLVYILGFLGPVAQSVEQRTENPCVGSSILPWATKVSRPTVLGWAFCFCGPGIGAGLPPIPRVSTGVCNLAIRPVCRYFFARCSQKRSKASFKSTHVKRPTTSFGCTCA